MMLVVVARRVRALSNSNFMVGLVPASTEFPKRSQDWRADSAPARRRFCTKMNGVSTDPTGVRSARKFGIPGELFVDESKKSN